MIRSQLSFFLSIYSFISLVLLLINKKYLFQFLRYFTSQSQTTGRPQQSTKRLEYLPRIWTLEWRSVSTILSCCRVFAMTSTNTSVSTFIYIWRCAKLYSSRLHSSRASCCRCASRRTVRSARPSLLAVF